MLDSGQQEKPLKASTLLGHWHCGCAVEQAQSSLVQPSRRKSTNYQQLHPLGATSAQISVDIFQSLQQRWQFSSLTDNDSESGVRCGGCWQTPQHS